jgi:hypothetical protein
MDFTAVGFREDLLTPVASMFEPVTPVLDQAEPFQYSQAATPATPAVLRFRQTV